MGSTARISEQQTRSSQPLQASEPSTVRQPREVSEPRCSSQPEWKSCTCAAFEDHWGMDATNGASVAEPRGSSHARPTARRARELSWLRLTWDRGVDSQIFGRYEWVEENILGNVALSLGNVAFSPPAD